MNDSLLVPWGERDDGVLVYASNAIKATVYRCPVPECRALLIVRAGPARVRHFAHKVTNISHETLLHWIAKKLVAQVVNDWKRGMGERPRIARNCPGCATVTEMPLPDQVVHAAVEERLPNGLIADVALAVAGGALPRLVEVFQSHEVDEAKRGRLTGYHWIEVNAEEVIREPILWKPRQDFLKPLACLVCAENRRVEAEKARRDAEARAKEEAEEAVLRARRDKRRRAEQRHLEELALEVGLKWKAPYVARARLCWHCRLETIVFAWPRERSYDWKRPPTPIPASIRTVPLKGRNRNYWANTCVHCGWAQGDQFIEGLFRG